MNALPETTALFWKVAEPAEMVSDDILKAGIDGGVAMGEERGAEFTVHLRCGAGGGDGGAGSDLQGTDRSVAADQETDVGIVEQDVGGVGDGDGAIGDIQMIEAAGVAGEGFGTAEGVDLVRLPAAPWSCFRHKTQRWRG